MDSDFALLFADAAADFHTQVEVRVHGTHTAVIAVAVAAVLVKLLWRTDLTEAQAKPSEHIDSADTVDSHHTLDSVVVEVAADSHWCTAALRLATWGSAEADVGTETGHTTDTAVADLGIAEVAGRTAVEVAHCMQVAVKASGTPDQCAVAAAAVVVDVAENYRRLMSVDCLRWKVAYQKRILIPVISGQCTAAAVAVRIAAAVDPHTVDSVVDLRIAAAAAESVGFVAAVDTVSDIPPP